MRAEAYSIPTVDRLRSKIIAGRIIPAIVTSTSVVSGLACLELYKVVKGNSTLEQYKNSFVNLGAEIFQASTPMEPIPKFFHKKPVSEWESLTFRPKKDLKLGQLLAIFKVYMYLGL